MLTLFDTPSLERALSLPLDPKLRRLLHERVDHLNALDFELQETSYFLVVEPSATMEDITDELGWAPLATSFEYVLDHGDWLEAMATASNEAVVIFLIQDTNSASHGLVEACRAQMP